MLFRSLNIDIPGKEELTSDTLTKKAPDWDKIAEMDEDLELKSIMKQIQEMFRSEERRVG